MIKGRIKKKNFRKLYEGVIGGLSVLFRNTPRKEVATNVPIRENYPILRPAPGKPSLVWYKTRFSKRSCLALNARRAERRIGKKNHQTQAGHRNSLPSSLAAVGRRSCGRKQRAKPQQSKNILMNGEKDLSATAAGLISFSWRLAAIDRADLVQIRL